MPARLRTSSTHRAFLAAETERLLDGARAAADPDGAFAWLDEDNRADHSRPRALWITARMAHVFSVGSLLGRSDDAPLADSGLQAIDSVFADRESGGWFSSVSAQGPVDTDKQAYDHVFVVLAASSGRLAGLPAAASLLERSLVVLESRFWDERAGALVDVWDRSWSHLEDYRGANANMHGVEAMLAASDATGDPAWAGRAARIVERLVLGEATDRGWRIPEHHDSSWTVVPDYNRDQPRHPFRPYGVTPGHGLEWARLLLHLNSVRPDERYVEAARRLFDTAVRDAWSEAAPGLAYTTDWDGVPVVRERFHWVLCEAIGAAATLAEVTGLERYDEWYARFWALAEERFIDRARGSWVHELDEAGVRSTGTWTGKPDVYHAVQATIIPRVPLTASLASGVLALSR
jgi:mannose/cellobiose epimerase-like protein (N-acyl-D-glucosamine 2-epimerase family)